MEDDKKILSHFDAIFNTETINNIKFDDMKLLNALYEYFEENLYTPSERYSALRKEHIAILDELEKTFTSWQKELFEKQWEIGSELCAEENEQLFLFGYIMAKELEKETIFIKENE